MNKRIIIVLTAMLLLPVTLRAELLDERMPRRGTPSQLKILPLPSTQWDSTRVYRQLVLLFEFSDTLFTMPDPQLYYDSVLNHPGYNKGAGPGCAAEYMLAQSGGRFHVHFDVFGPYQVNTTAKHKYLETNRGSTEISAAILAFKKAYPDMDCSVYDWNGNGGVDQIVFIAAGPSGNEGHTGFIWPNTDAIGNAITLQDGLKIEQTSVSTSTYKTQKVWGLLGYGTLVHEYGHCFGLPDVYPTKPPYVDSLYSIADCWDLMDGGNFINRGWCPPNYTAMEKMFLNWLTPVELDHDTTITGMLPVADGGEAYLIRHTEDEYLLLENRRQTGWDYGIPGEGLTIWHIDFDSLKWKLNDINGSALRCNLYHADNLSYEEWAKGLTSKTAYAMDPLLRCRCLSTSAYPWTTDSTTFVNDCLSENSTPALVMNNKNAAGSTDLGKRITHIERASDGTISFTLECYDTQMGVENKMVSPVRTQKILRNGQILILRGGKTYTILGL